MTLYKLDPICGIPLIYDLELEYTFPSSEVTFENKILQIEYSIL